MTEKDKLLNTLFNSADKKLLNLKFCRMEGGQKTVSEETFCATVNKVLFEIDTGLIEPVTVFDGDTGKTVDVKDVARRFAN